MFSILLVRPNTPKPPKQELHNYFLYLYQISQVYKENIIDVSVACGKAAAKAKVKRFIEVSTAQVYDADKVSYLVI